MGLVKKSEFLVDNGQLEFPDASKTVHRKYETEKLQKVSFVFCYFFVQGRLRHWKYYTDKVPKFFLLNPGDGKVLGSSTLINSFFVQYMLYFLLL